MDWSKWFLSGIKAFLITLLAVILAVITEALSHILTGYRPEGVLKQAVWLYLVAPAFALIIGWLKNYLQHKNDEPKPAG